MAALKKKLTSLDGLDAATQALYKKAGGGFILDLEDEAEPEDKATLERALANAKEDTRKAKAKLAELEAASEAAKEEAARAKGDLPALEASFKKKLADREKELMGQLDSKDSLLREVFVTNAARDLASQLSEKPGVLLPHVLPRLRMEFVDGQPITRVLDKEGKPSALGLSDLKKEFLDNPDFAGIVAVSRASGGGAHGGQGGGGAAPDAALKNADGSTNWTAVAEAAGKDPSVLERFK